MFVFLMSVDDEVLRTQLEEIYYLYRKELWYVAYDILNDEYEAEDVVQTALLKMARYLEKKVDVKCNKIKALIVIIVRNIAINIYRQRKTYRTVDFDSLAFDLSSDDEAIPEIHVLRLDQIHYVSKKLNEIKPEYADILTLRYEYEYTNEEISKMLDIEEGNARVRLMRARRALHDVMEGDLNE